VWKNYIRKKTLRIGVKPGNAHQPLTTQKIDKAENTTIGLNFMIPPKIHVVFQ